MKMDVCIVNKEDLERKIKKFAKDGAEKIHVLSDFDRTLTKNFAKGERINTVIAQLRDGGYLTPDYPKKARELHAKYYPIEKDNNLSIKEKIPQMAKWWKEHFDLIIKSGIDKETITKIARERPLPFRKGSKEFVNLLYEKNIPLIIISASVGDMIIEYMKLENMFHNNIHVIGNNFEYDENGKVTGIKFPIVHVFNKEEITLKNLPIYKQLLKRKNVILIGDSIGDLGMIEGFDYDEIIRIGFLNENVDEQLGDYKSKFDVVILNDGDFDYVNGLMKRILD